MKIIPISANKLAKRHHNDYLTYNKLCHLRNNSTFFVMNYESSHIVLWAKYSIYLKIIIARILFIAHINSKAFYDNPGAKTTSSKSIFVSDRLNEYPVPKTRSSNTDSRQGDTRSLGLANFS